MKFRLLVVWLVASLLLFIASYFHVALSLCILGMFSFCSIPNNEYLKLHQFTLANVKSKKMFQPTKGRPTTIAINQNNRPTIDSKHRIAIQAISKRTCLANGSRIAEKSNWGAASGYAT